MTNRARIFSAISSMSSPATKSGEWLLFGHPMSAAGCWVMRGVFSKINFNIFHHDFPGLPRVWRMTAMGPCCFHLLLHEQMQILPEAAEEVKTDLTSARPARPARLSGRTPMCTTHIGTHRDSSELIWTESGQNLD